MANYIPFINTIRDCQILNKYYKDSDIIRVSLESIGKIKTQINKNAILWIDPAIDGYHHRLANNWPKDKSTWNSTKTQLWNNIDAVFKKLSHNDLLEDESHWTKTNYKKIKLFIHEVLNKCNQYKPKWISVPQLPLVNDGKRNKINRWLAEATGEWNCGQNKVKLILPVIFTSTTQLTSKPIRDNKLKLVKDCYGKAKADGIWITDTTLSDQARNEQYPNRYSKLIEFHENIKNNLTKNATIIAGPYWGINIVLWARELCDHYAISMGTPYIYYISCGTQRKGNTRLLIPPIKRWVVVHNDLRSWLQNALTIISHEDPARKDLIELISNFSQLRNSDFAIEQVAKQYKKWLDDIEIMPSKGRTLGLYQYLSSVFVFGKQLPNLPESTLPHCSSKMREAGKVGEQLMLKCL